MWRSEPPTQQTTVSGGCQDHQHGRHQLPHQQLQAVVESLGDGGGGEDTHRLSPGQGEGGADSELRGGGQQGQQEEGQEDVGGDCLELGRDHQADYQVVGEALAGFISI